MGLPRLLSISLFTTPQKRKQRNSNHPSILQYLVHRSSNLSQLIVMVLAATSLPLSRDSRLICYPSHAAPPDHSSVVDNRNLGPTLSSPSAILDFGQKVPTSGLSKMCVKMIDNTTSPFAANDSTLPPSPSTHTPGAQANLTSYYSPEYAVRCYTIGWAASILLGRLRISNPHTSPGVLTPTPLV
ncbi:hypothetical protein ASPTUDRAFT_217413 [Aspergillus tubingensis CBS 134.48]|uniref:Uncharacterized protein n=1 Tax=Aspergillus tubingensis (strain CBS 134.48) TaxID=767770 RepID=A0A1L9NLM8_ASPTC|nr:hypothetical protein ASPTUDRAFT_217413 [Aspergillus tubingensis CBS 134.48]